MLITTNREWPLDFPLQKVIDDRFAAGEQDGMPTTDMIQEMYSGRTDEAFEKLVNAGPVRYQASHILVEEEAKAKKIIVELDGGADFAELAKSTRLDLQGQLAEVSVGLAKGKWSPSSQPQ